MKKDKPAASNRAGKTSAPRPVIKPAPAPAHKRDPWFLALCLLIPACALFIYSKTLNYPLDKLDERPIFVNMDVFSSAHPSIWDGVKVDAFFGVTKTDVLFYRPIQNVSYLIDRSVWGSDPFGVHFTNLLLFVCICYALLYLLTLFGVNRLLAAVIALVFCCHPLYAIAVVWVPSRGDLLSTLFSVLSFASFINYTSSRRRRSLAGCVVFFFLALFSKESVIGLPLLFMAYLFLRDKAFYRNKQNVIIVGAALGVSVLYLAVRQIIAMSEPISEHLFTIANFLANLRALPEALAKIIIPVSLSPMPSYSTLPTVLGLGLLAALCVAIFYFKDKLAVLSLGLVWFLVFMVPGLFFQHRFAIHSYKYLEHRILMPSVGIILIIAIVCQYFFERFKKPMIVTGAAIAVIFMAYTSGYATIFENQFSFYGRVLTVDPENILAHSNMANSYFNGKKYDSALYHESEALRVYPHFTLALENRSKMYTQLGDYNKALADLDTLLAIDTTNAVYYSMRGNTENTMQQYPQALSDFNRSLQLDPDNGDVLTNKGTVMDKQNRKDSALIYYQKAIKAAPGSPWAYINAGLLESNAQNYPVAIDYYNKALQIKPDYWDVYLNRGIACYYLKDFTKALADYNQYLSHVPGNNLALNNMGILKINMGQKAEGCACLQKAAAAGNADAVNNLRIYCK